MIDFEPVGIAEQRLEPGRGIVACRPEADEMLVAAAVGKLDQAQPVAPREQPHRLGIDRDRTVGEAHVRGQILLVEVNAHDAAPTFLRDWVMVMDFRP